MTRRLICVWTANHVAHVRGEDTASDVIVSFDLDASALLDAANIPYIEAHTFISMDEVDAFQQPAAELARTWYKPLESECLIDGVSPLEMEQKSLYTFFHNALCARLIVTRILDRFPCQHLLIFDYPRDPIVFTDLHENATMPILRYQAERRGIQVHVVNAPQAEPTRIPVRSRRSRLRNIVNLLRNRWYWQRQFWRSASRRTPVTCLVLLINEGSRYAQVVDQLLSRLGDDLVISVVGGRSSAGLRLDNFDWFYLSFSLLPDHRYILLKRLGKRWYAAWRRCQSLYQGDYPDVLANPYFEFQYRYFFCTRLINTGQTFREARVIFKHLKTKQLITSTIPDLNAAGVIHAANSAHIAIVSLPHSGIPTEPNLTHLDDTVIAWTNDYREVWKDAVKPEGLHIVGLHPSIIARGYRQSFSSSPLDRTLKRITLLMSTVQLSALPYVDVDAHRRALRLLTQLPAHLKGRVEVRFKLHPMYDFQHFYESLIPPNSDSIQIIRDRSIDEVIAESDLTVLVNINTSAHLLALAQSVPLLHIHTASSWFRAYDRLDEWGRDFTVAREEDIWPTIERILFDSAYQETILAANRAYWEKLGADQPDPVAGISALLNPH